MVPVTVTLLVVLLLVPTPIVALYVSNNIVPPEVAVRYHIVGRRGEVLFATVTVELYN